MIDFLQTQNSILNDRINELERKSNDMKEYIDYLTKEMNKLHETMVEISSEEYLEFKKMKIRDKGIDNLLKDEEI